MWLPSQFMDLKFVGKYIPRVQTASQQSVTQQLTYFSSFWWLFLSRESKYALFQNLPLFACSDKAFASHLAPDCVYCLTVCFTKYALWKISPYKNSRETLSEIVCPHWPPREKKRRDSSSFISFIHWKSYNDMFQIDNLYFKSIYINAILFFGSQISG